MFQLPQFYTQPGVIGTVGGVIGTGGSVCKGHIFMAFYFEQSTEILFLTYILQIIKKIIYNCCFCASQILGFKFYDLKKKTPD